MNATNGNKIWNETLDNYGLLVVDKGTLFVTYNHVSGYENGGNYSGVTYNGNICAFDTSNGTKLWNNTLGGAGYFFDSNSPPSIIDGIGYVGSFDHNLYAFNSSTGSIIWKIPIISNLISSPSVVDNNILFFSRQNKTVYASILPYEPPLPSHIPVTFEQKTQFPYQMPIFAAAVLIVIITFFLFQNGTLDAEFTQKRVQPQTIDINQSE